MSTKLTIFFITALAMLCPALKAQTTAPTLPLYPIEADSIYLMDFFWDSMQKKAQANDSTPVKHSWAVKPLPAAKVAKLAGKWEKATADIIITGAHRNKADNLATAVKDFDASWQLFMLTGHSRYIDYAERTLVNRIIPLWLNNPKAKGSKEANDILRTVDQMAYSVNGKDVYINTFMRSNAHLQNADFNIYLQTMSSAPWYYETSLAFADNMEPAQAMDDKQLNPLQREITYAETTLDSSYAVLHIRIPSWLTGQDMLPNHKTQAKRERIQFIVKGTICKPEIRDGYAIITGHWGVRDLISVRIPTPILRVTDEKSPSHIALQRGPIVYAFEQLDPSATLDPSAPIDHQFSHEHQAITLSGNTTANGQSTPFSALPYYISKQNAPLFAPKK